MTVMEPPRHLADNTLDTNKEESYSPDLLNRGQTILGVLFAAFGGGLATLLCWKILKTTNLPAFGASLVTQALSSLTSFLVLLMVAGVMLMWLRDEKRRQARPRWRTALSYGVTYLSPAALVVTTLAIPLAPTRLYLDGLNVDQGFRTQFLTRLTDDWHLSDMNYIDLPSFYPSLWFWFGGRLGNLLGIPGWETFQPWALVSIAAAACVLVPVWQRLTGSLPIATAIALVTTAITLVMNPEEPYAAIVALGVPAVSVLLNRALMGRRLAIIGSTLFLGYSASAYTLYTAVMALSAIIVAAIFSGFIFRSIEPLLRLVIIGVGSIAFAAIWWHPYLWQVLSGKPTNEATATHYLPIDGSQFPLPMLAPSVIGLLCTIGVIYLLARAGNSDVRVMGISLMLFYAWAGLSMAMTLTGRTLLGFRLDTVITLQLATAGVLGLAELRLFSVHHLFPTPFSAKTSHMINTVMVALLTIGSLSYVQNIPQYNARGLHHAFSDTDGYGQRADRYPADASQYYQEISQTIQADLGDRPQREIVVLTDERNFMSFHPFRGFQGFTSHYANPLGEFDRRNETIEEWAERSWTTANTPETFEDQLDRIPWKAPDAFIFRADLADTTQRLARDKSVDGWNYDLAEDIYPNNPNVRFRGIRFNPNIFLGPDSMWQAHQIGPFVVVTRS